VFDLDDLIILYTPGDDYLAIWKGSKGQASQLHKIYKRMVLLSN